MKLIVDIYGADAGPVPIVQGVARGMEELEELHPVFVGEEACIRAALAPWNFSPTRYSVIHTTDFVAPEDEAASVFRGREQTSLVMALRCLKEDPEAIALLSPGNTGALLVGSMVHLGLIDGVKAPILSSALPCSGDRLMCLVDCGASMDCKPKDLARFALMGSSFIRCLCGIRQPRVGLMSVGREDQKGTALTLEAFRLLQELPIHFIGNLEGSDMVTDQADVIVTDGFVGNVLLKNTEAVGADAIKLVDAALEAASEGEKALLLTLRQKLQEKYDFNARGGATFLGTKKPVIKMHGCATRDTAYACVMQALRLKQADFISDLERTLQ